jgi:type I restriction enzyme S subunit
MKAVIPNAKLHPEYLLYAFVQFKGRLAREVGTSAHGTRRISTSAIEQFVLPLPTPRVQSQISDALHDIDCKIAVEESRKASLDTLFSTLLHDLTGGAMRIPNGEW